MPRGRSAEEYKRISTFNKFWGIVILIALITGYYFVFNYIIGSGILERDKDHSQVKTTNVSP